MRGSLCELFIDTSTTEDLEKKKVTGGIMWRKQGIHYVYIVHVWLLKYVKKGKQEINSENKKDTQVVCVGTAYTYVLICVFIFISRNDVQKE